MQNRISLDDIAIAVPCRAKWDDMVGTDRVRSCSLCQLSVYNISDMTKREAETFLNAQTTGSYCLKLSRRADGTILTKDCPVGQKLLHIARRRMRACAALFLGMFNLLPAFCADDKAGAKSDLRLPQLTSVEKYGFGVNMNPSSIPHETDPGTQKLLAHTKEQSAIAEFSANTNYQRGQMCERLGQFQAALTYYRTANSIVEQNLEIYDTKFVKAIAGKCAELNNKTSPKDRGDESVASKQAKVVAPKSKVDTSGKPNQ